MDEVAGSYLSGESITEISKKYKKSRLSIRKFLKSVGIYGNMPTHNCRKYTINTKAFCQESEESLYWQGFLMADGHVAKNYTLEVHLCIDDYSHLEKLKSFLNYNGPLKKRNGITCKLRVTSRELCQHLEPVGICAKSLSRVPNSAQEGSSHFWRGVIDGDGWVSTTKHIAVTLIGGDILIDKFISFCKTNLDINHITKRKRKSEGLYEATLNGKKAKKLINLLYSSSTIYLDRKFKRAMDIMA